MSKRDDSKKDEISRETFWWDFQTREDLRTLYQAMMDSKLDSRGRIWDTIKASSAVTAALLGVAAVALIRPDTNHWFLIVYGVILVFLGWFLSRFNFFNVRREQAHEIEKEFTLYQIEKLLGLHRPIETQDRWLTGAAFMFGKKHLNQQFVEGSVSTQERKGNNANANDLQVLVEQSGARVDEYVNKRVADDSRKGPRRGFVWGPGLWFSLIWGGVLALTGIMAFWYGFQRLDHDRGSGTNPDIIKLQTQTRDLENSIKNLDEKVDSYRKEMKSDIKGLEEKIEEAFRIRERLGAPERSAPGKAKVPVPAR